MPYRRMPLATDQFYHVFNRSFNKQNIFIDKSDYFRALKTLNLYQHSVNIKFSYFKVHGKEGQKKIIENTQKLIEVIAYCFMPNHFHLIVKQKIDDGIVRSIGKFSTSYSKYFNTKRNKIGPVFQGRFKAVLIENNNQLLHVSRYIHLNPYSAEIIKDKDKLINYKYSSLSEYVFDLKEKICDSSVVLDQFKSKKSYFDFVLDNAEYQQSLQRVKKLLLDEEE